MILTKCCTKPRMDKLIQSEFGFQQIEIKKLNGYENENFLVTTNTSAYIFKTYKYNDALNDLVKAENNILLLLQKLNKHKYPKPIQFTDNSFVKTLEINSEKKICRMLSFLKGESLGDVKQTKELFQSFGIFLAEMDIDLQTSTSYTIKARQWEWDMQYMDLNKKYINDIPNAKDRSIVNYFFQQFEENVKPLLPNLRKQIIHNDANEWNVIVNNGIVSSIIDFGDLAYSQLINELGIAIAYACLDKENPLEWALIILKSYHSKLPLEENEIKVLYYLVATRLSISVCNSAHSKKINPSNEYASMSEKSAWKMLYRWLSINPINAENKFRSAIGLAIKKPLTSKEVTEKRHRHISNILSLSYDKPIYMVRSAFQYMYDAYGNTFLDAYNNIPHVGHSHPKVVAAGKLALRNDPSGLII